jgi:hypothetical protein
MTSAQLRKNFAELGYNFYGTRGNWNVNGYNCASLSEAKSLLQAMNDKKKFGGVVFFDGADWRCNVEDHKDAYYCGTSN